ncbi:uncharacterized protein LOC144447599 [Glandiceps talaboti]
MPIMYSCGCCSLKAGNQTCSILILIEMVVNLVVYVYGVLELLLDKPDLDEEIYLGMEVAFYVMIGLFVIVMVLASVYFCGAIKNDAGLLIAWVVGAVIYMILELGGTVYITYVYHVHLGGLTEEIYPLALLIWYGVRTVLNILFLVCAISQYQEIMEKERKIRRHRLIPREAERRF